MRLTPLVLSTVLAHSFRKFYKAHCAGLPRLQLGHRTADSMLTLPPPLPVASRGLRNVCIWHRSTFTVPCVRLCVPAVNATASQQQQHSTNISSMRALHVAGDDATDQQHTNEEVEIVLDVSSPPDAWSSFLESLFLRGFFEPNSSGKGRYANMRVEAPLCILPLVCKHLKLNHSLSQTSAPHCAVVYPPLLPQCLQSGTKRWLHFSSHAANSR